MPYISKNITRQELIFYKDIIDELSIVFDVGVMCDNPFYALKPSLEIHMFEPVKKFLDSVRNDLKGKEHNVHLNNIGLGSKTETKEFHYRYGSIIKRDKPRFNGMHDAYDINIITLDDYCKDNNIEEIDYLKIDTEGYDFEVIKGASNMLDKIRFIQFEDFNVFYGGETVEDIFDYFAGWNIYRIGGKPCNYLATKETVNLKKVR